MKKATLNLVHSSPASKPLRIWWIPQIPGKPFHVKVNSVNEAKKVINILADYDKFQFENHIKPDYANSGGLEVLQDQAKDEWWEWHDEDTDDDIMEILHREWYPT